MLTFPPNVNKPLGAHWLTLRVSEQTVACAIFFVLTVHVRMILVVSTLLPIGCSAVSLAPRTGLPRVRHRGLFLLPIVLTHVNRQVAFL